MPLNKETKPVGIDSHYNLIVLQEKETTFFLFIEKVYYKMKSRKLGFWKGSYFFSWDGISVVIQMGYAFFLFNFQLKILEKPTE